MYINVNMFINTQIQYTKLCISYLSVRSFFYIYYISHGIFAEFYFALLSNSVGWQRFKITIQNSNYFSPSNQLLLGLSEPWCVLQDSCFPSDEEEGMYCADLSPMSTAMASAESPRQREHYCEMHRDHQRLWKRLVHQRPAAVHLVNSIYHPSQTVSTGRQ